MKWILALGLTLVGTGCAFSNVDVFPPARGAPPVPVAGGPGRNREVIVHAPFADDRADRTRCGMQKNGYNMDTANVDCKEEPGRWLADELAGELARAGYRPLRADAVPGPNTVVLQGTVQQLFLEPVHGFFTLTVEGDFAARLEATSASGLRAERRFFVKGTDESLASTEGVFQSAANDASRRLARQMVAALTELLDRYPDLGAPSASAPAAPLAQRSP